MSQTTPAVLRAGIIGTGFMGGVHAAAVRAAGHMISSVAGSTPAAGADAAARLGARRAAASAAELIASADVDVVHICTPNATHAELSAAALEAGKAVICEKPLATSTGETESLVQAAGRSGRLAAVPFVYRFYPTVREARARIASGEAGDLWLLHGSYLQDWLAGSSATNWRVDPAQGGLSRAFGDIGVHWCDLMEFVTGHRILRLVASTANAYRERGGEAARTEDGAVVLFETDRGAAGSLVVSQVTPGRKNRLWFSFDGTQASYSFDQEQPDTLWVGGTADNRIVFRGPDTLTSDDSRRLARLPAGHPQGYQDSFTAFVSDAYAVAAGEERDGVPTFADGHRAAVLTAAVIDSAKINSWVEVPV
jgi:predicted dehydrogenase